MKKHTHVVLYTLLLLNAAVTWKACFGLANYSRHSIPAHQCSIQRLDSLVYQACNKIDAIIEKEEVTPFLNKNLRKALDNIPPMDNWEEEDLANLVDHLCSPLDLDEV